MGRRSHTASNSPRSKKPCRVLWSESRVTVGILPCRSAAPRAARFGEAVSEGSFVRSDKGCENGGLVGASDDTDIQRRQAREVLYWDLLKTHPTLGVASQPQTCAR